MSLTSNPNNIRYNGTGRVYAAEVGGDALMDFGELENFNFNSAVSHEQMRSNRTADRSVILERESERTANLTWGARELTDKIVAMALMGSAISESAQSAGHRLADEPTLEADSYIDLGHVDVSITRVTGTITGTIAFDDTLTGADSAATAKVAWTASGLVELVNVDGDIQVGEKLELDTDNYITASGVSVARDVVVTNDAATPATRYVQGTDYDLDADYGLIRKLSSGTMGEDAAVSYNYPPVDMHTFNAMEASSVERKIMFVTDGADGGPRFRVTFWRVNVSLSGDWSLIGDGASTLPFQATVMRDLTRPVGQQFARVEKLSA